MGPRVHPHPACPGAPRGTRVGTRLSAEGTGASLGRLATTQGWALNSGSATWTVKPPETHRLLRNQNENVLSRNVYRKCCLN